MVTLSKIYTKTGDQGTTGLGDGQRRKKHDIRVSAYGEVDEANACIGLICVELKALESKEAAEIHDVLAAIQNDLFDVGSDLCVPETTTTRANPLRIKPEQVERIEAAIDQYNADLAPLTSFILPGGTKVAAFTHLARTVTRRAERAVTLLAEEEEINPNAAIYLNRLSDLLFVLGRVVNDQGKLDILWRPALNQS